MEFSKTLLSTLVIGIFAVSPVFAAEKAKINPEEMGMLATIAAIDTNEIVLGAVAGSKDQSDDDINDFAKMMIDQHGQNLSQILTMANGVPLTGGNAEKMSTEGRAAMTKLGALSGKDFNEAYINAMVDGHTAVLKLIDSKLMNNAKSDDVKKFLTDTRTAVSHHLEQAKKIQEDMKS